MNRPRVILYTPDAVTAALSPLGWACRVAGVSDCAFGIEAKRDGWCADVVSFGQGLSVGIRHDADDIRGVGANLESEGVWAVALPWYSRTTTEQALRLAEGIQHLAALTAALSAARSPRIEARVRVPLSLHPSKIEVRE
jgi:hypothetical protein